MALLQSQSNYGMWPVNDAELIFSNTLGWARSQPDVRGLVLVGSRAQAGRTDDLADFDLQVYTQTAEPYTRDEAWLSTIAPVWVCVHDAYVYGGLVVPTRLVIFAGGTKVDFAFYPATSMAAAIQDAPAYRVILDKDDVVSDPDRHPARPQRAGEPSEAEFARIVREFWFEAYHVAKYLARGDLWLAKSRDWATKEFLRTMIEWHARAERGWSLDTHHAGKQMRVWADSGVWEELHRTFARFAADDSWDALLATTELFRRLATDTAAALGFVYPEEVDRSISGFIRELRDATSSRAR